MDDVALWTAIGAAISGIGNIYSIYAGSEDHQKAIEALQKATARHEKSEERLSEHFTATQQQVDRFIDQLGQGR